MNIWMRDLESGADRQLTRGAAAAMQAAWSPDGSRIAFSDPEGQIQIVDVQTGAVTMAHDHLNEAGRASWSPDGTALVSRRSRSTRRAFARAPIRCCASRSTASRIAGSIRCRTSRSACAKTTARSGRPTARRWPRSSTGFCTVWPVARDGAPRGSPRPLSTERAGSPTLDRRLAPHPVSERRSVSSWSMSRRAASSRTIDPRLTWTPAAVPPGSKTIHAGRFWNGRGDTAQTNIDIVVDGSRIKSVEPHDDALHAGASSTPRGRR